MISPRRRTWSWRPSSAPGTTAGSCPTPSTPRRGSGRSEQAKAYYDAHPDEESFDHKILNDNSFTETLCVPAATLYGNQRLGSHNGSQNERITPDRLVARACGGDRQKVAVWLKRSSSGSVIYLAEQYLP